MALTKADIEERMERMKLENKKEDNMVMSIYNKINEIKKEKQNNKIKIL